MSKSIDPQSKKIIKKGLRNAYPVLLILRLFVITSVDPSCSKQNKPNGIETLVSNKVRKKVGWGEKWIQI